MMLRNDHYNCDDHQVRRNNIDESRGGLLHGTIIWPKDTLFHSPGKITK